LVALSHHLLWPVAEDVGLGEVDDVEVCAIVTLETPTNIAAAAKRSLF
jgi:hypothetical protein